MWVRFLPARPTVPSKENRWQRTAIMFGGRKRITKVEWRKYFEIFLVMWFGLTMLLIIYFISTRNHPLSRVITICGWLSTDISMEFVPAFFKEVNMSDELNYIWCRECGKLVHYTPANTVIYYFKDYPWYSAAETHCHYCDYKQALFLVENLEWEINWAIENDIGFIMLDDIPPEHIVKSFERIYPGAPSYHELTTGEDAIALYFAYLLDTLPEEEWFDG